MKKTFSETTKLIPMPIKNTQIYTWSSKRTLFTGNRSLCVLAKQESNPEEQNQKEPKQEAPLSSAYFPLYGLGYTCETTQVSCPGRLQTASGCRPWQAYDSDPAKPGQHSTSYPIEFTSHPSHYYSSCLSAHTDTQLRVHESFLQEFH